MNCLVCRKPFKTIVGADKKPITYFCTRHQQSLTEAQKDWVLEQAQAKLPVR